MYQILITGPDTFIGRNLILALRAIQSGKDRIHRVEAVGNPAEIELVTCDQSVPLEELEEHCRRADFVFHLAEVTKAKDMDDFMAKNFKFTERLEDALCRLKNPCPVVFASSYHATLLGRYARSPYGEVKQAEELLLNTVGKLTNVHTVIFRFPDLFGRLCPPGDAAVVPALCRSIAEDLPIPEAVRKLELELVYMEDVVETLLDVLNGLERRCRFDELAVVPDPAGKFCYVPRSYRLTAGDVIDLLERFKKLSGQALESVLAPGSFTHRLDLTYLSSARLGTAQR